MNGVSRTVAQAAGHHARQPAGDAFHAFGGARLTLFDGLVNGQHEQVLQVCQPGFIGEIDGLFVDGNALDTLVARDHDLHRAAADGDFQRLLGQGLLRSGHIFLHLLNLAEHPGLSAGDTCRAAQPFAATSFTHPIPPPVQM